MPTVWLESRVGPALRQPVLQAWSVVHPAARATTRVQAPVEPVALESPTEEPVAAAELSTRTAISSATTSTLARVTLERMALVVPLEVPVERQILESPVTTRLVPVPTALKVQQDSLGTTVSVVEQAPLVLLGQLELLAPVVAAVVAVAPPTAGMTTPVPAVVAAVLVALLQPLLALAARPALRPLQSV